MKCWFLAIVCLLVASKVVIPSLSEEIYSPQIARGVGGFVDSPPITGDLIVYDGNPCKLSPEAAASFKNMVVLISNGPLCTWETMYGNFQSALAVGTISRYQDNGPASIHLGIKSFHSLTLFKEMVHFLGQ